MRIFVDTNILLSTALFPTGLASQAYAKVLADRHDLVVSDHVIRELRDVGEHKFSDRLQLIEDFIAALDGFATIVEAPRVPTHGEASVRDPKDWPVLRAARFARCDLILSGDKDLLEAGIAAPEVLTPRAFVERL